MASVSSSASSSASNSILHSTMASSSASNLILHSTMASSSSSKLILQSPFLVCMASGDLMEETFRNFISQELRIVDSLIKMLKSDCFIGDESLIEDLKKGLLLNKQKLKKLVRVNYPANPKILQYTKFLLGTASGNVAGDQLQIPIPQRRAHILGAMAPHIQLYEFMSKNVQSLDGNGSSQPLKMWIGYCTHDCQGVCLYHAYCMERLCKPLSDDEKAIVHQLSTKAIKLELDFFFAQPMVEKTIVPLVQKTIVPLVQKNTSKHHLMVITDFETCSTRDSSQILAEIAMLNSSKVTQNQIDGGDLSSTWKMLSDRYEAEYEKCLIKILLRDRAKEFKYLALNKSLKKISAVVKNKNIRVKESGFLKGITSEEIICAGKNLTFREGCMSFFGSITEDKNIAPAPLIYVISNCWSTKLIEAGFASGGLHDVEICANHLWPAESRFSGDIIKCVETPYEKVKRLKEIKEYSTSDCRKHYLSIYIGNSVGDLQCLLEADIGIVLETDTGTDGKNWNGRLSSERLRDVATQFGVTFVPLLKGLVQQQQKIGKGINTCCWEKQRGELYTVSTWEEIKAMFVGLL